MSASPPAIEAVGLGRDDGSTRALGSLHLVVARELEIAQSLVAIGATSLVTFGLTGLLVDPQQRFVRRGPPAQV